MHCKLVWLFCQSNKRFIKWIKNFQSLFIGGETLLFFTSRSWSWSSISYASGQNSNDAAWFPNGWQVMDNLHYKLLTFWFRQEKQSIIAGGKGILKLVTSQNLLAKYSKIKFANFVCIWITRRKSYHFTANFGSYVVTFFRLIQIL